MASWLQAMVADTPDWLLIYGPFPSSVSNDCWLFIGLLVITVHWTGIGVQLSGPAARAHTVAAKPARAVLNIEVKPPLPQGAIFRPENGQTDRFSCLDSDFEASKLPNDI
jgi:hypothetical protein